MTSTSVKLMTSWRTSCHVNVNWAFDAMTSQHLKSLKMKWKFASIYFHFLNLN